MYRFSPILTPYIWGTENWILSAYPEYPSVVAEGQEEGKTLAELIAAHGAKLVGKRNFERYGNTFPLLIKFIDARNDLSIQVHPDDEMAHRKGLPCGKTEMWYALPSAPDAYLYSGIKEGTDIEQFKQTIGKAEMIDSLARYDVKADDCFFLPAGRIHAIGAGCQVCEIQQTSDTTYRIYDYNRIGKDGKPRQLHIEESKEAIDYTTILSDYRTPYTPKKNEAVTLIDCPYFTTRVLDIDGSVHRDYSKGDSFIIVICLTGEGTLTADGNSKKIAANEVYLLPATTSEVLLSGTMKCLEVTTA